MADLVVKKDTKFKKGDNPNPGGRPTIPAVVKEFQKTTYSHFVDSIQKYGNMDRKEVKEVIKNPTSKAFDVIFAKIVDQSADGDRHAREVLLDRIWGKPKEAEFGVISHMELLDKIPISVLIELARKNKEMSQAQVIDTDTTPRLTS